MKIQYVVKVPAEVHDGEWQELYMSKYSRELTLIPRLMRRFGSKSECKRVASQHGYSLSDIEIVEATNV